MAQNPNITKLDQRDALKRCIDAQEDTLRVQLIEGSVQATVNLSSESMGITGLTEEGLKVPLRLSSDGKLLLDESQLKALLETKGGASGSPVISEVKTVVQEIRLEPLPKEYLEALKEVTVALNEVALKAGKETVTETLREVPVEKIVEKQVIIKEVPKWVWILVGAQAGALLISLV